MPISNIYPSSSEFHIVSGTFYIVLHVFFIVIR